MWIKMLGSFLVITAGSFIGFTLANNFTYRLVQIRQILTVLTLLKSNINYISMLLPEALIASTNGVEGPIKKLFCRTGVLLDADGCLKPCEAMSLALDEVRPMLRLSHEEYELLFSLGTNLGLINCREQEKYIAMIEARFKDLEAEAVKKRDQNVKMYRYLGVCGSLVIVIILL